MNNKPLVVFDLDKTLITGNIWENFNAALGVSAEQDYRLYNAFSLNDITYEEWLNKLRDLYNLTSNKHSKEEVTAYLTDFTVSSEAAETIPIIHDQGFTTALIAGSFQVTADEVARQLGI